MIKFDMDINQNFASFKLADKTMFVENLDDINFEVRAGNSSESKHLANITAKNTSQLNAK